VTEKQVHDGQKTKIKGRIVAKGFQESNKPQADSPTVFTQPVGFLLEVCLIPEISTM